MFSGAKHKIQQWRKKKNPPRNITSLRRVLTEVADVFKDVGVFRLSEIQQEIESILEKLKGQVKDLTDIGEDPGPIEAKIEILQQTRCAIEKGLEDKEAKSSLAKCAEAAAQAEDCLKLEVKKLLEEKSRLENENRSLRTELQIFTDHLERSEVKVAELEVHVEHLKFMNSLPSETDSFLETEEKKDDDDDDEEKECDPEEVFTFLEEDYTLEDTSSYLLGKLDMLDFTEHSRLKILCDLIKTYLQDGACDIVVCLLKSTIEELAAKECPHDRNIFTMTEVVARLLYMTQRYKASLDVFNEILQTRKQMLSFDKVGLAETLSMVAILHTKVGKVKAARVFSRQALDIKNTVFGDNHIETAKELHNLGVLYCYDKQYPRGINCMLSAFLTFRSCPERNMFYLGTVAANVASAHFLNNEYLKARQACGTMLVFLLKELAILLMEKNLAELDEAFEKKEELNVILDDDDNKEYIIKLVYFIENIKKKLIIAAQFSSGPDYSDDAKEKEDYPQLTLKPI